MLFLVSSNSSHDNCTWETRLVQISWAISCPLQRITALLPSWAPQGAQWWRLCRRCKRHGLDPWSEDSPGGGIATHASILVWEISQTEESEELQSTGSQGAGHDRVTKHTAITEALWWTDTCLSPSWFKLLEEGSSTLTFVLLSRLWALQLRMSTALGKRPKKGSFKPSKWKAPVVEFYSLHENKISEQIKRIFKLHNF